MYTRVLGAHELWQGEMLRVAAGNRHLVLLKIGEEVHAYEDRCSHQAAPLSAGTLDGRVLQCSAHHWQFDATTGEGINPRATRLRKFPVIRVGDDILVDLGETS